MKLPIKNKIVRRGVHSLFVFAIISPVISAALLISAVYAQSTQCNGQTNAIVFDSSFTNQTITAGNSFSITAYKCDSNAQIDVTYNGVIHMSDDTGTMSPTTSGDFNDGTWTGNVTITRVAYPDQITGYTGNIMGDSSEFVVNPGSEEFLSLIGGSAQTSRVGTQASTALTVKAIDQFGNPIPNIGVNYSIPGYPPTATGQTLSAYSVTTNGSGLASTKFTLGSKIGTYTVNAAIGGGTNISSGVTFYENATSGPLSTITISPLTSILPKGGSQPFTIQGFDSDGNSVTLSPPTWSVVNGGGTIDSNGNFTSGDTPGTYPNTVKVAVGSVGATASVTVINENISQSGGTSSSGQSGTGSSSGSGTTPTPTPTPSPTPSEDYVTVTTTPAYVTVTPTLPAVPIDHVTINPNPVTVAAGSSVIVNAQAYDAQNNPINDCQITWQLSSGAGSLSQNYGTSTSINASTTPGNGTIIAVATDTTGSKTVQAQVIVQAVPQQQKILNTNIGGGKLVIKTIASPQNTGVPFDVVILAEDNNNNILGTFTGPVSLDDTTHTLSPGDADTFNNGVWNGNVVIQVAQTKDIITAHGLGYSGTSNEFDVVGKAAPNLLQNIGKGINNVIVQANQGPSKTDSLRILGAGIAAGLGLLGSAVSIGFMSARGVEAIGRNPFARTKIQVAMTISLVLCIGIAVLSIASAVLIK